ncbi:MAG: hypothetical protein F6J90_14035 [Moorea sp. SIOASIH]|uniref:hypothetical protein n=1 Tax=Moorena sp. SIOASIH TaxID=2607817 RepID=UPI0013BBC398|nr:hypothetical protein [Moorena sp. SIOASIH]NEO37381.1 hypothetical protein [Moorena sp. SIOASIH]
MLSKQPLRERTTVIGSISTTVNANGICLRPRYAITRSHHRISFLLFPIPCLAQAYMASQLKMP